MAHHRNLNKSNTMCAFYSGAGTEFTYVFWGDLLMDLSFRCSVLLINLYPFGIFKLFLEKVIWTTDNLIKISSMHLLPPPLFLFWSLCGSDQNKKRGTKCVELSLIRLDIRKTIIKSDLSKLLHYTYAKLIHFCPILFWCHLIIC